MKTTKIVILLFAAIIMVGRSSAFADKHQGTIGYLMQACNHYVRYIDGDKTATSYLAGFCSGFFKRLIENPKDRLLAQGVTEHQLALVFIKWAIAHPEEHHIAPMIGVRAALEDGYLCQRVKRETTSTIGELRSDCKAAVAFANRSPQHSPVHAQFCYGFFAAGLRTLGMVVLDGKRLACFPTGTTVEHLIAEFVRQGESLQSDLDLSVALGFVAGSFPCTTE